MVTPVVHQRGTSLSWSATSPTGSDSAPYTNQQVGITGIVPAGNPAAGDGHCGSSESRRKLYRPSTDPRTRCSTPIKSPGRAGNTPSGPVSNTNFCSGIFSFASLLRGFLFSPRFNDFLIRAFSGGNPGHRRNGRPRHVFPVSVLRAQRARTALFTAIRERNADWYAQDDWKVNRQT